VLSNGLLHYLDVLGIDTETGRLRTAKNYLYMLAGIVYRVRMLVVEKMLPAAQREEQTVKNRDRFLEMRKNHLADGSYSPPPPLRKAVHSFGLTLPVECHSTISLNLSSLPYPFIHLDDLIVSLYGHEPSRTVCPDLQR
jgi:hypothetical protein